jgi:hypothetical protein
MDTRKQGDALDKILKSLIECFEERYHTNEATIKNNFFYHLRLNNPNYLITVEENLANHVNLSGRADFYLSDSETKSYYNDIVLEFKINCRNLNLIRHDINKLEKIKKLNPHIVGIFINVIEDEIDFIKFLKVVDLFKKTKVYALVICDKVANFLINDKIERKILGLDSTTLITNCDRILGCGNRIEINEIPTIRVPNLNGQTKFINVYPNSKTNAYWKQNKQKKPFFRFAYPQ